MKLVWTPEARGDRDAIYAYIENDNPAAALDRDGLFVKRAAHLLSHPMIGRPGRECSRAGRASELYSDL